MRQLIDAIVVGGVGFLTIFFFLVLAHVIAYAMS